MIASKEATAIPRPTERKNDIFDGGFLCQLILPNYLGYRHESLDVRDILK